jgi:hypothetical protein
VLAAATVLFAGGLTPGLASGAGASSTTPQCNTAVLTAKLLAGSPGGGQRFATVVLTNAGAQHRGPASPRLGRAMTSTTGAR